MTLNPKTTIIILSSLLFVFLTIAGIISYKSIDWDVLKKIESQQLILPTPVPVSSSTNDSTSSAQNK